MRATHALTIMVAVTLTALAPAARAQDCTGEGTIVAQDPFVGEVWSAANSPYQVTTDIDIAALTIEPGVCVLVDGPYEINVTGILTAAGTEDAPITFKRKDKDDEWLGIVFNNTQPGSVLEHCRIEGSVDHGLTLINTTPEIRACTFANNTVSGTGGGLYVELASGELILNECVFEGNTSTSHGGGIRAILEENAALTLDNCLLRANTANPTNSLVNAVGGAIYHTGGTIQIIDGMFLQNATYGRCSGSHCVASARGGAIYVSGSATAFITGSTFSANDTFEQHSGGFSSGVSRGAGIYVASGSLNILNSIFSCNENHGSNWAGTGVYVESGDATLMNCTLVNNNDTAVHEGSGSISVVNSILFFNNGEGSQFGGGSVSINYSCVQNIDPDFGEGNISFSPVFASGDGCCWWDFVTASVSPCVDAGDPKSVTDPECIPPAHGDPMLYDMGAFGGPGNCTWTPPPGDCNGDFFRNIFDFTCFQETFADGDMAADCNEDGALNVFDFICFQTEFQSGCD